MQKRRIVGQIVGVLAGGIVCASWLGCPPTPVSPPVTCGFNATGVCGGTCPADQQCSSPSPTVCACTAAEGGSPFCGFNAAHVCGGPCPPGQTCTAHGPTVCACFPADGGGG
jgi:hypothetical protein